MMLWRMIQKSTYKLLEVKNVEAKGENIRKFDRKIQFVEFRGQKKKM